MPAGELPTATPPRPQGRERNVVVTMWDWADPKVYLHDEIGTDKRNPTVNANGPIYGALEESADYMPVIDPTRNAASQVKLTVRDPKTPSAANTPPAAPSPYWGDEVIWNSQTSTHSFAMDGQGRVWAASRIRQIATEPWCQAGSDHPSAKAFPLTQSGRQLEMYDPKTKQTHPIDTCYSWGHANFDKNDVLWSSFGPGVEGWFDTRIWDKTHDEQKAQGWTVFVLDTNGNGKRDAYVEADQPLDPAKDKRMNGQFYGVSPSPDGSIWGTIQADAWRNHASRSRIEPARNGALGILRSAVQQSESARVRLCAARDGRRQQGRGLDGSLERTTRQFRSHQVQGSAERTDGNGPALS